MAEPQPWEPEELGPQPESANWRDYMSNRPEADGGFMRDYFLKRSRQLGHSVDAQIDRTVQAESAFMARNAQTLANHALQNWRNEEHREWQSLALSLAKRTDVDR